MQFAEVEVTVARLDVDRETVRALAGSLSDEERGRAWRFHFERHRRRFIVARARLRQMLTVRLGLRSRSIELAYGPHGKPALAPGSATADWRFNVSHSGDIAVLAFCRGREVGVDVEAVRAIEGADAIAAHFFSPREFQAYCALAPSDRELGFFTCWTRHEACLKALGRGLGSGADDTDGAPARDGNGTRWRLQSFSPSPGHAAAIAVEHGGNAGR